MTARSCIHVALLLALPALLAGCDQGDSWTGQTPAEAAASPERLGRTLLNSAVDILDQSARLDTRDAVYRALDQFNQWIETAEPLEGWRPDPLLKTLPEPLQELPQVKAMAPLQFPREDALALQEVVWLRDTAATAVGESVAPLERAARLFDWTVRNLQLVEEGDGDDAASRPPYVPWQILMFGRATAAERAWAFSLLARQQQLEVVVIEPSRVDDETADSGTPLLAALLHEGELYLFDPRLGLPIPGPDGQQVATLSQAAADDALLRQLDLPDEPYWLTAEQLQQASVRLEATPLYLSQRSVLLEAQLIGARQMVLTTDPSGLAERLAEHENIEQVTLWELPYERLRNRDDMSDAQRARLEQEIVPLRSPTDTLWTGRLMHLLGQWSGDKNAVTAYIQTRPTDDVLDELARHESAEYQRNSAIMRVAKQQATYWLGLLAYERGQYETAANYFQELVLEKAPESPWRSGASYNLARSYEAQQQPAEAAAALRAATETLQRHGNLVRAQRLEQRTSGR